MKLVRANCLSVLRALPEGVFDALITDPPYGTHLMRLGWDRVLPPRAVWAEALRVAPLLMAFGGSRTFHRLACMLEDEGWEIEDTVAWLFAHRKPSGKARLKPCWDPIIVAVRDKLSLDIDAGRLPAPEGDRESYGIDGDERSARHLNVYGEWGGSKRTPYVRPEEGRWPANVALDKEVAADLDASVRRCKGSPSRFFYCSRATVKERGEGNTHPNVKPVDLMCWLVRLSGARRVLDPFMGSGTTGIACMKEGVGFMGIEADEHYFEIAKRRVEEQDEVSRV